MKTLNYLIEEMTQERRLHIREPRSFSWGDTDHCRQGFRTTFLAVDKTITNYQHLPEYEEIIDWMTNTEGKGLLLMGDCGRGKSIIITGVVPILLRLQGKYANPIHSDEFEKPYRFAYDTGYSRHTQTSLDYLVKAAFPIIDELGVESMVNNYGEKSEGFNQVINAAEHYLRPVFVTTNLTKLEILHRYGERTLDRLGHLCRVIEFKGESLR